MEEQFVPPDAKSDNQLNLAFEGPSGDACSQSAPSGPELVAQPARRPRPKVWLLTVLSTCCFFGAVGGVALFWLTTPPPSTNCQQLSSISSDWDQLYCAQEAARSGELPQLLAGLNLLKQWTPEHPLYQEAQRLIANWSESVLMIVRQKVEANKLQEALAIAKQIPASSPSYKEAQSIVTDLQQQWSRGEAIAAIAQKALQNQDWDRASQQVVALRELKHDYWRIQQANELTQQIFNEKQARQIVAQAKPLAETRDPEQVGAAIAQLSQMNRKTHTWKVIQPALKDWSEMVLAVSVQQSQSGNLSRAIALAQQVAKNPQLTQAANDLIRLSQARQLVVASTSSWQPSPHQLWRLSEAVAAVSRIASNSRFYNQAQASLKTWKAQLRDVVQVQVAAVAAGLEQPFTLDIAIAQAQQIPPGSPQRLQAQTLVAHWQATTKRLQDQPYLTYAQALAESGAIPDLKAAISLAKQVALGRPLRSEAQTLIAGWHKSIQTIEDQPLLDQARTLADQGKLSEAIQQAAKITAGRALYGDAQVSIQTWQAQIRAAEVARAQVSQNERLPESPWRSSRRNEATSATTSDSYFDPPMGEAGSSTNDAYPGETEPGFYNPPPRSGSAREPLPSGDAMPASPVMAEPAPPRPTLPPTVQPTAPVYLPPQPVAPVPAVPVNPGSADRVVPTVPVAPDPVP